MSVRSRVAALERLNPADLPEREEVPTLSAAELAEQDVAVEAILRTVMGAKWFRRAASDFVAGREPPALIEPDDEDLEVA